MCCHCVNASPHLPRKFYFWRTRADITGPHITSLTPSVSTAYVWLSTSIRQTVRLLTCNFCDRQRRPQYSQLKRPSQCVLVRRMETNPIPVVTVQTSPFDDQRPGTNGLRRKTEVFEGKKNYLQNYIQSLLSSIDLRDRQGCTMVVGSDGRYFSRAATEVIVQMAAANGVTQ